MRVETPVVIFFVALLLRLILFLIAVPHPDRFVEVDSREYDALAKNMIRSGVYSMSQGPPFLPDVLRVPGYPVFLSLFYLLFGEGPCWPIVGQLLLGALTCLLTYRLASRLFSAKAGMIAGLLLSFDLLSINFNNLLLSETLFTFLLLLGLYFLWRGLERHSISDLLLASVSIALTPLCRTVGLYFFVALALLVFFHRGWDLAHRLGRVLIFVLFPLLAISAWSYRNYRAADFPGFSLSGNYNLLFYRAAAVEAELEGTSFEEKQREMMLQFAEFDGEEMKSEYEYLRTARKNSMYRDRAVKIITEHPLVFLKIEAWGMFNMLFTPTRSSLAALLGVPTGEPIFLFWKSRSLDEIIAGLRSSPLLFLLLIFLQLLFLVVMWGAVLVTVWQLLRQRENLRLVFLLLPICYFAFASGGPEAYSRFRVPIMPYLIILASYGLAWAGDKFKNGGHKSSPISKEREPEQQL